MQRISLVDETFDLNFTLEYLLSIQLSLDGFSFSILDTIQNKVIYLFHQELFEAEPDFLLKRLKSIYEESDLLELPFKRTRILIDAPGRSVLIPEEIYQAEHCEEYINTAMAPRPNCVTRSTPIPAFHQWAVYEIPQVVNDFLKEKHQGAEFINALKINCPDFSQSKSKLRVTILKKQLVLTAVHESKLCFQNCFFYDSENDMLFYTLGSVKNMDQEPACILLDGIVNKHTTIYHLLRQYFPQVEIASNPKGIHYSYLLDKLPDARFVNLFNSFVCA